MEAWDGAVDPRRSRLTLSVTVLDVDDNSPVFAQRSYNVSIPENSPKDKVILQLRVSGGRAVGPPVGRWLCSHSIGFQVNF